MTIDGERDLAKENLQLRAALDSISRSLAATVNGWPYEHQPALHWSQALKLACDEIEDLRRLLKK